MNSLNDSKNNTCMCILSTTTTCLYSFSRGRPYNLRGGRCCLLQSEEGNNRDKWSEQAPLLSFLPPPQLNPLMGQMGMESGPINTHKSRTFTVPTPGQCWCCCGVRHYIKNSYVCMGVHMCIEYMNKCRHVLHCEFIIHICTYTCIHAYTRDASDLQNRGAEKVSPERFSVRW